MAIWFKQLSEDDVTILKFSDDAPTCEVYRNSQEVQDWLLAGNEIETIQKNPKPEDEPIEVDLPGPSEWR
jgi:hypothetical protein